LNGRIPHVRRAKKDTPAVHPLRGDKLLALRRLKREQAPASSYVFTSECGSPFSTAGFAKMIERARAEAGFDFKAHPHKLRHACGYALANKRHDTRAIQDGSDIGRSPARRFCGRRSCRSFSTAWTGKRWLHASWIDRCALDKSPDCAGDSRCF
jgi:integrase